MPNRVEFDLIFPHTEETLRSHVVASLSRGLPDLARLPQRPDTLTIVANGPSANNTPIGDGPMLAVNGSINLFTQHGIAPTYWIGCDPQAYLAELLPDNPPKDTCYLVSSKCHPDVFDRLKHRKVAIWHLDEHAYWDLVSERDPVMTCCTVTLCAFEVMHRLGFRKFETWGWDGCFFGDMAHATDQPGSDAVRMIEVGDKVFRTTTSWAIEAQDAIHKFLVNPFDVNIHGGGMIGEIVRHWREGHLCLS